MGKRSAVDVAKKPEKERRLIRDFAAALLNTADQHQGKISNKGIGRFMMVFTNRDDPRERGRKHGTRYRDRNF